jgi:hypothetical protein
MDYIKHYNLLMEKAKNRSKPKEYCELHHIIPTHKGGSDCKDNLVYLTGREHFLAHFMLGKAYGGKDWFPVASFVRGMNKHRKGIKISKILHAVGKKEAIKVHSKFMRAYYKNPEARLVSSIAATKQSQDKEALARRVQKLKDVYKDPEFKEKIRQKTIEGMKCPILRKRISDNIKLHYKSPPGETKSTCAVKVRCKETGTVFNSMKFAAAWLQSIGHTKAGHACIRDSIIGRQKHSYGYHWEYA